MPPSRAKRTSKRVQSKPKSTTEPPVETEVEDQINVGEVLLGDDASSEEDKKTSQPSKRTATPKSARIAQRNNVELSPVQRRVSTRRTRGTSPTPKKSDNLNEPSDKQAKLILSQLPNLPPTSPLTQPNPVVTPGRIQPKTPLSLPPLPPLPPFASPPFTSPPYTRQTSTYYPQTVSPFPILNPNIQHRVSNIQTPLTEQPRKFNTPIQSPRPPTPPLSVTHSSSMTSFNAEQENVVMRRKSSMEREPEETAKVDRMSPLRKETEVDETPKPPRDWTKIMKKTGYWSLVVSGVLLALWLAMNMSQAVIRFASLPSACYDQPELTGLSRVLSAPSTFLVTSVFCPIQNKLKPLEFCIPGGEDDTLPSAYLPPDCVPCPLNANCSIDAATQHSIVTCNPGYTLIKEGVFNFGPINKSKRVTCHPDKSFDQLVEKVVRQAEKGLKEEKVRALCSSIGVDVSAKGEQLNDLGMIGDGTGWVTDNEMETWLMSFFPDKEAIPEVWKNHAIDKLSQLPSVHSEKQKHIFNHTPQLPFRCRLWMSYESHKRAVYKFLFLSTLLVAAGVAVVVYVKLALKERELQRYMIALSRYHLQQQNRSGQSVGVVPSVLRNRVFDDEELTNNVREKAKMKAWKQTLAQLKSDRRVAVGYEKVNGIQEETLGWTDPVYDVAYPTAPWVKRRQEKERKEIHERELRMEEKRLEQMGRYDTVRNAERQTIAHTSSQQEQKPKRSSLINIRRTI
ncbi:putative Man1-Src1p-C-terminal domain containing protein [Blattamonas nauphoetae]|uniref:Man1-Src1p-C-terminal domain containing protein n=1 Tax=Blattamonas nauphoetae TaxID=2049346 RepID=A0ABQ9XWJ8_9EUKA|nr:putative Man1-Src1p-C-terminal domain containing protein [Blattamonas nauphoetae]